MKDFKELKQDSHHAHTVQNNNILYLKTADFISLLFYKTETTKRTFDCHDSNSKTFYSVLEIFFIFFHTKF